VTTIIGLHGYAQSGKDTVAGFLKDYGYVRFAFADRLRECVYALNPVVSRATSDEVRLQELVDALGWDEVKVTYDEVRRLLQVFGTEVGRELIKDSLWVDIVLDQIADRMLIAQGKFVITDMRFPNEVDGLSDFAVDMGVDLQLWKITRPGVGPVNTHVSDAGLADDLFDLIIENDGTLDDLRDKALLAAGLEVPA
jgi:hypothetical protein